MHTRIIICIYKYAQTQLYTCTHQTQTHSSCCDYYIEQTIMTDSNDKHLQHIVHRKTKKWL